MLRQFRIVAVALAALAAAGCGIKGPLVLPPPTPPVAAPAPAPATTPAGTGATSPDPAQPARKP